MTRYLVSLLRQSADECPDISPTLVASGIRQGKLMHRRRRRAVLAGVAVGVAAAVAVGILAGNWPGDDRSETEPVGDDTTVPGITDEDALVSCGGDEGWPPSVMAEGVPGLLDEAEATETFQAILDDPQLSQEAELSILSDGVDVEWRVLRGDEDSLTLGLGHWTEKGPAGADAYVLGLERAGDHWTPDGWGTCNNLAPTLPEGSKWAMVSSYNATSAEATTLQVEVTENQCTSGRDPWPVPARTYGRRGRGIRDDLLDHDTARGCRELSGQPQRHPRHQTRRPTGGTRSIGRLAVPTRAHQSELNRTTARHSRHRRQYSTLAAPARLTARYWRPSVSRRGWEWGSRLGIWRVREVACPKSRCGVVSRSRWSQSRCPVALPGPSPSCVAGTRSSSMVSVDQVGQPAFQAAHRFHRCLAGRVLAVEVGASFAGTAQLHGGHDVQGAVDLPVPLAR